MSKIFLTRSFKLCFIYISPQLITVDKYFRAFQFKILNNVLHLDKTFSSLENVSPLCVNTVKIAVKYTYRFFVNAKLSMLSVGMS